MSEISGMGSFWVNPSTKRSIEHEAPKETEHTAEVKTPTTPSRSRGEAPVEESFYAEAELYETEATDKKNKRHKVIKKETLYSISTKYGISVADLVKANPNLKTDKNGNKIIQEGQILNLPSSAKIEKPKSKQTSTPEQKFGNWQIEPGKGSFSVMSKFNLYKEELQKLNPHINLDDIKAGETFKVPGYEVKSGDSFASIAKAHDITKKMLMELNPNVKELKAGQTINVPKKVGEDLGLGEIEIEVEEFTSQPNKTHTIAKNETLYRIAKANNVPVWALMLSNKIPDPTKVEIGQVLEIPSEAEIKELETAKETAQKAESAQQEKTIQHKVRKNEFLSTIAEKYGVPQWALVAKNNISKPDDLSVGQVLQIPNKNEIKELREANLRNKQTAKATSKTVKRKSTSTKPAVAEAGTISQKGALVNHKVRPKDTIKSIAKEYGVNVKDLQAYNPKLKGLSTSKALAKENITSVNIVGNKRAVLEATGVSPKFIDELISIEKKLSTLKPDDCGKLTIGIGHNTEAHKDTKEYQGKTLNDTQIYSLLARDIMEAQETTKRTLGKTYDKLSQRQKEALYSLIFNTGGLSDSPRLIKAIKAGNYAEAAKQFDQIYGTVNKKKQVMGGLAKRRFQEISTFLDGTKLTKRELTSVMAKVQVIYDKGYRSIRHKNNRVDYNAYAKKFLGEYIDQGLIRILS